ncbi:MAG: LacI family transcriptional regulator [Granulosicoccus sp.]
MSKESKTKISKRADSRPTLRTVAEACGLAVTTVSRALNNGEDIALKTRNRVKKVADELGYVPNRAGRGLRTGRTHMLSLVLAPHAEISGYTASIIAGFGDICRDSGYELSATPDVTDADELTVVKSIVENNRADGIVLSRTTPQDLRVRYLLEKNFPFVTHGRTELATPHAQVDYDNQSFAEQAVNRLVSKGRKRLILIGAAEGLTYHVHLETGFARGVAKNGIESVELSTSLNLETSLDDVRATIKQMFSQPNPPDGVVCSGEMAALATYAGARDAGFTPGKDLDVVSKQTSAALDHVHPAIDSFYEDIALTGRILGMTLLEVIAREKPLGELQHMIAPIPKFRT